MSDENLVVRIAGIRLPRALVAATDRVELTRLVAAELADLTSADVRPTVGGPRPGSARVAVSSGAGAEEIARAVASHVRARLQPGAPT